MWDFLVFEPFLFKIVIVACSCSGNGTFGHPEAVLGDNGYCPVQSGMHGHITHTRQSVAKSHKSRRVLVSVGSECARQLARPRDSRPQWVNHQNVA
ncbi:hypothetical protein AVEN_49558-1 [Araneus ventricosus]|uniref:Secreted protein n=1 Tax=Araneus ventricosus TaxID=182803 RepID=A0A4Y2HRH7_ARAVE|nr:hypothetical protein AVEN_49558-1 [Araneus ventricosus]